MKTKKEQRVAIDILGELLMCKDMDDVVKVYHAMLDKYELCEDKFTTYPCTLEEYLESAEEYQRQHSYEYSDRYDIID
jgi:hypothetical protein